MTTINRNIRLRYGAAADYATSNRLLLAGEKAIESDTLREKVGDGTTLYNDLPYSDDVQRGYKVYEALVNLIEGELVAEILQNGLGGEIVWTVDNASGGFRGTLSGAFPQGKTVSPQHQTKAFSVANDGFYNIHLDRSNNNSVRFMASDDSLSPVTDDFVSGKFIEIRVYL